MGGGVSRFAGSGTLKRLVSAANLPLEVDDDISQDQLRDPGRVKQRSQHKASTVLVVDPVSLQTSICVAGS